MNWRPKLNIDPIKLREMNMVQEGDHMPAYYGETATSLRTKSLV